ncbi:MAG: SDR family oxidoreductase [Rhodospirillales bacterium]|nr:SDR family oxidoreductase [Rhodospirillales bacterium]
MAVNSDHSNDIDIEFRDVTKRYSDVVAVDDISLTVERGSFFSFLGPSGCGKTTSLRIIAGFEQPTNGDVYISGESVIGIPPHKRPVNMVFQHYALFPHITVAENIGYGLRQRSPKPSQGEMDKQIDETLEMVQMSGFRERWVWEMSGGQQHRVALARALINHPTVLLLDEPLATLDRKLRRDMQIELQTLQRDVGITFILVTHDQEEALSMSDRICIMRDGTIAQSGSPRELYDHPVSRYVADFVGKTNFVPGSISDINGQSIRIKSEADFGASKAVVGYMKEQGGGSIIITPSNSGVFVDEGMLAYITTKAAVIMMVKQIALDYARDNIRCNALCPGWVDTPFNDPYIRQMGGRSEIEKYVSESIPMGRWASIEEIAESVLFLASDRSSFMTGHALVIDGGECIV